MADFCQQCSLDLFGLDHHDLAHQGTKEDNDEGKFAIVLCEGCGAIQVDVEGRCVSEDCLQNGHKNKKRATQ